MLGQYNLIECDLSGNADFENWGLDDIAYIKKDFVDGKSVWSIYGAEGTCIGYAGDRNVAFALAGKNDLTPMSVH